jgi:AAHS family 4-hydroxybenzoate transporter-like MFS transporter
MAERINIANSVDSSPIGGLQVRLFILCALCLIMDGFDVQMLGPVAPAIASEWGVQRSEFGVVFGASNFGVLLGALIFTMVADKVGRRPVLVWSTIFFSVMMLVTTLARSLDELLILRFITGLGLGSIIPNATALIGEYSPKRHRVTLMMTISVGFTAGAALGGFAAGWLEPYGWRSVFYVGGVIPLVIGVAMLFWLPESLQFLALRPAGREHLRYWLARLNPAVPVSADSEYVVSEEHRGGVPATHLFREGRTAATILLWVVNFMNILILYSLANWIPTVLVDAGYAQGTGSYATGLLQLGGMIGTFAFAWLIGRHGFTRVLTTSFALACVSIAAIGLSINSLGLLLVIVFAAGWFVIGAQPGVNAFAATLYPTYLRSTGIGWGLGIGRIGAIVGPVIGGELLAREWPPAQLFYAAALPAVASTTGMLLLHFAMKRRQTAAAAEGVLAR